MTLKCVERAWSFVDPYLKNKYLVKTDEEDDPELTVRLPSGHLRTLYVDQKTMKILKQVGTPRVIKPFTFSQLVSLYKQQTNKQT